MVNRFETYFVAYHAYFTAELHLGHFENLVFVIMSTMENISLIARTSCILQFFWALCTHHISVDFKMMKVRKKAKIKNR